MPFTTLILRKFRVDKNSYLWYNNSNSTTKHSYLTVLHNTLIWVDGKYEKRKGR